MNRIAVPVAAAMARPETHAPSAGDWLALAMTAAIGTIALAPAIVAAGLLVGWRVALIAWLVWLCLAIPFALPMLANALGRSIAGWREPDADERRLLEEALVRVCVAAGTDHTGFTLRIANGLFNAHSSGRGVLATSADVLRGDYAAEKTETEAMLAHELAHHRDGDLLLAGPRWWLLTPLVPFDLLAYALSRIPVVGRIVAEAVRFPIRVLAFPLRAVSAMAGRPRELMADRFAVHCGYALPLERVLLRAASVRAPWRGGLVEWMLNTHPGTSDRITAIRNAAMRGSA